MPEIRTQVPDCDRPDRIIKRTGIHVCMLICSGNAGTLYYWQKEEGVYSLPLQKLRCTKEACLAY
jgi:hypothetical protein